MSLLFLTTTNSVFFRGAKPVTPINPTKLTCKRFPYTSCQQQKSQDNGNDEPNVIDRRNVLFGLTGVYGATSTFDNMAIGAPVQPPDLSKCNLATDTKIPAPDNKFQCCPPYGNVPIKHFKLPDLSQPLRIRQPAHKLDSKNLAKFKEAIAKMKALPEDDPWNFYQQAQIHCAYCNEGYNQVEYPKVPLQVHYGWLFPAWHRYYLYFWEKILGKLIGDPTLAIPFWNWDTPDGMRMPPVYLDESSPLYDANRNKSHLSSLIDYSKDTTSVDEPSTILNNLRFINTLFTETLKDPNLFVGKPVLAGEIPDNDMGRLESLHNVFHQWTGPDTAPFWDMGNFHTAARDTLFWAHHGNVDRLWYIYGFIRGTTVDFKNDDYLNASFIFYDENRQVVKCKLKDCLDISNLGYTYQREEIPWKNIRRKYLKQKKAKKSVGLTPVTDFGTKPRVLDTTIRVLVKRPKVSLTKDDQEDVTEVLIVEDIKFDDGKEQISFNVYIAKPIDGSATSDLGEVAGSFVYVAHSHGKKNIKNVLSLGITNLVDDLEAQSSDTLVVSLVPVSGKVTIGGVKIVLVPVEEEDD